MRKDSTRETNSLILLIRVISQEEVTSISYSSLWIEVGLMILSSFYLSLFQKIKLAVPI